MHSTPTFGRHQEAFVHLQLSFSVCKPLEEGFVRFIDNQNAAVTSSSNKRRVFPCYFASRQNRLGSESVNSGVTMELCAAVSTELIAIINASKLDCTPVQSGVFVQACQLAKPFPVVLPQPVQLRAMLCRSQHRDGKEQFSDREHFDLLAFFWSCLIMDP